MSTTFLRLLRETDGQDLVEYALLASSLALGAISAMTSVRDAINTHFTTISDTLAASGS